MASNATNSFVNTTFPVLLPHIPELAASTSDFEAYIARLLESKPAKWTAEIGIKDIVTNRDGSTPTEQPRNDSDKAEKATLPQPVPSETSAAPFMQALLSEPVAPSAKQLENKMLTDNGDMAHQTSTSPLVDIFFELEDAVSSNRLRTLLEQAWEDDADATLKLIWNSRSIHLGKSSRTSFYRCVGWLAEEHPVTLVANLPWLVRPLIQKKVPKKKAPKDGEKDSATVEPEAKEDDSDFELVDKDDEEGQSPRKKQKLDREGEMSEFDVRYGVAHGYWKDLLNILMLRVAGELRVDGNPRSVLNIEKPDDKKKWKRKWSHEDAKTRKEAVKADRHQNAVDALENDAVYRALHLTIARLFADQLKSDLACIKSGNKKQLSLCGKWAPSNKGVHDQYTFIASTIAELLHPFDDVCPEGTDPADRTLYLKYARSAYQSQTLSPLRRALEVVERSLTTRKFEEIKYERLPSLAMRQYTKLFAAKDYERFDAYLEKVASGKAKISGATLLPSTLVKAVKYGAYGRSTRTVKKGTNALVEQKLHEIELKSIDGQWKTLVQRIKDSGTLQSSISVCDVSGSMGGPTFPDGTCPMDSAIGLSLLIAEVTEPPFGGAFITFSEHPEVVRVGGGADTRSLVEKVQIIQGSQWAMNTDFVAVFEKLILPMAVENNLKQEDMVKQVFVFSDMQFDAANSNRYRAGQDSWDTSYERIQKKFRLAGYEMPKLIFWNLAGGRAGYGNEYSDDGRDVAPKPVTAAEEGTALVSGYSQGQMKMFLENGQFTDEPDEEEIVEEEGKDEDGDAVMVSTKVTKAKMDPLTTVKKAISHEAYRMLKVVD